MTRVTICAPPFSESIGGIYALYLLARKLQERGVDVGIWGMEGRSVNPTPSRRPLPWQLKWHAGPVECVVYPEIVHGNPLQAPKVCRWLLSPDPVEVGPTDLLFHYVDGYARDGSNRLCLFDRRPSIYYPPEVGAPRSGTCFCVRKGVNQPRIKQTEGAAELGDWLPPLTWAKAFRSYNVFYSYDEATFLSALAAVCGCISVIVPTSRRLQEWYAAQPLLRRGVAYGIEELQHAVNTMDETAAYLDQLSQEYESDITHFLTRVNT